VKKNEQKTKIPNNNDKLQNIRPSVRAILAIGERSALPVAHKKKSEKK